MMTVLALATLAAATIAAHGAYLVVQQTLAGASVEIVGGIIETAAGAAVVALTCGGILAFNLAMGA